MLYDSCVKEGFREGNVMYRILLVDDEWLELDTLEKYIPWEEMGFQVAGTAENGKEALQLLERLEGSENEEENDRKLPDVVLTDVKMPVMDGLAFSKILHDRYPDIQIVFLSGYNDFEYVRSVLAVEACGYILKPLNTEELKGTMEKVRGKMFPILPGEKIPGCGYGGEFSKSSRLQCGRKRGIVGRYLPFL